MKLHVLTCTLAAAFAIGLLNPPDAHAQGGPKNARIVVFGDSLSDTGRADIVSTALRDALEEDGVPPGELPPVIPGPHYFPFGEEQQFGRFSNGPVWVEHLAEMLGLPVPAPVNAGGTNFAVGGALTSTILADPTNPESPVLSPHPAIIQMDEQVAQYIATTNRGHARWNLFIVWGGANDIIFPFSQVPWFGGEWPLGPDPEGAAQNIADQVRALHDAGARNFIVPNLPLLGTTLPLTNLLVAHTGEDDLPDQLDGLSTKFNRTLSKQLDRIERDHRGINIVRLDLPALVEDIFEDPRSFGLAAEHFGDFAARLIVGEDADGPILAPLEPGAPGELTLVVHEDEDEFMFWDPMHVSATTHLAIAERAFDTLAGDVLAELEASAAE